MRFVAWHTAIDWIARNDHPNDDISNTDEAMETVQNYATTRMVADLFDAPIERVARYILRRRREILNMRSAA